MLEKSIVGKIRAHSKLVKSKYPKEFSQLTIGMRHNEFSALMPKTSKRLRAITGCYNKLTSDIIYHFINAGNKLVSCKICGADVDFNFKKGIPRTYCSNSCANEDPAVKIKMLATINAFSPERKEARYKQARATLKSNYGVTNMMQSKVIKNRAFETNIAKYGHKIATQSQRLRTQMAETYANKSDEEKSAILSKVRATSINRYGVEHPCQSEQIKKDTVKRHRLKYGVDHPGQRPEVIAKIQKKHDARTDKEWEEIHKKKEATCIKTYGVRHPFQKDSILQKAVDKRHRFKPTILLGKSRSLQGYEPYVLKSIESKIKKLVTGESDLPKIIYINPKTNRSSRYYIDAAVRTINENKVLIEIKSPYTLQSDRDVNLAKFKAATKWAKTNNFTFVLAISDGKSYITWIVNPTAAKLKAYF